MVQELYKFFIFHEISNLSHDHHFTIYEIRTGKLLTTDRLYQLHGGVPKENKCSYVFINVCVHSSVYVHILYMTFLRNIRT
jgi:hypothetical protein